MAEKAVDVQYVLVWRRVAEAGKSRCAGTEFKDGRCCLWQRLPPHNVGTWDHLLPYQTMPAYLPDQQRSS